VFSVTLVTIYGQTRILYAIAKDGLVPKAFQSVNPKSHAPVSNTLIVSLVVGIVAGLVDSTYLWDMVSMGTLTAFVVVSVAVPVLRAQERAAGIYTKGGFRVPFGPYAVPGLSILACAYLMVNLSHATKVIFTIWMVVAVLTYFIYGIRNSRLNKA
jgi:APA family basic amino acid/polyamine antiporter